MVDLARSGIARLIRSLAASMTAVNDPALLVAAAAKTRPPARVWEWARILAGATVGGLLLWQAGSAVQAASRTCLSAWRGQALVSLAADDVTMLACRKADNAFALLRAHCRPGDDVVIETAATLAGAVAAVRVRVLAYPIRVFDLAGYGAGSIKRSSRVFHLALSIGGQAPPATPVGLPLVEIARNDDAVLSRVVIGGRGGG